MLPNTGIGDQASITIAQAVATFYRPLSVGMSGTDVAALQTALEQKGFLVIPAGISKGYYGALTRSAIFKYQTRSSLPSVGVFGPMTRAKLISELGN
jgi:peptidoglycan hydrolase-like protein with peptidoglycan-binding domain